MGIHIYSIGGNRRYWLVRTEHGEYYDYFRSGEFIAIGWNKFTNFEFLTQAPADMVVEQIRETLPKQHGPRHVFNQMHRFIKEMVIGDIVIIPSRHSQYISFGIITSDAFLATEEETEIGLCSFVKRRKVRWVKTIRRNHLDPLLYKLLYSRHTISDANNYAPYIDRTLYSLFEKNGIVHLVLNVTRRDSVYAKDLRDLLDRIEASIYELGKLAEHPISYDDLQIKVNVQSPGPIEIISGGIGLIALTIVLHYIIGGRFSSKVTLTGIEINGETEGLLKRLSEKHTMQVDNSVLQEQASLLQKSLSDLGIKIPAEISDSTDEKLVND